MELFFLLLLAVAHGPRARLRLSGGVRAAGLGHPDDPDRGEPLGGSSPATPTPSSRRAAPHEWLAAGVTNFRGVYWEVERDTLIAVPALHLHGHHAAALEDRRGPAADHGPAVRADPGRPGHLGRLRRRAARRDDGHRRRDRRRDGAHLAAGDDAQQVQHPAVDRDHRRLGHARPDHSAVDRADHPGRPARLGGRPGADRAGRTSSSPPPASSRCRPSSPSPRPRPATCSWARSSPASCSSAST